MFESEKLREFVLHISKQGSVTKKTQKFYGSMGYYMAIWNLRDAGMVIEDGFDEEKQKVWKLTEQGDKLAKLFKQLRIVNGEIEELVGERLKL
jgi:predicted transcriptional regulator